MDLKIRNLINLILVTIMLSFLSCKKYDDLPTVKEVDINKYLGDWYEIMRLPNKFEKGLECVSANYSFKENGKIKVLNKGHKVEEKGKAKTAEGTAWLPDDNYPGRLKVTFFWPFAGDYYIIELDDDYKYVLVGDPSRKYLWILARNKKLDSLIIDKLLDSAKNHGFDIDKMIKVKQECE